jgi:hypothetical protein
MMAALSAERTAGSHTYLLMPLVFLHAACVDSYHNRRHTSSPIMKHCPDLLR